jgi:hypothetical protein
MGANNGSDAGTGSVGTERIAAFSDGRHRHHHRHHHHDYGACVEALGGRARGEVWSSFLTPLAPSSGSTY